jgi:hypothetical protein
MEPKGRYCPLATARGLVIYTGHAPQGAEMGFGLTECDH